MEREAGRVCARSATSRLLGQRPRTKPPLVARCLCVSRLSGRQNDRVGFLHTIHPVTVLNGIRFILLDSSFYLLAPRPRPHFPSRRPLAASSPQSAGLLQMIPGQRLANSHPFLRSDRLQTDPPALFSRDKVPTLAASPKVADFHVDLTIKPIDGNSLDSHRLCHVCLLTTTGCG